MPAASGCPWWRAWWHRRLRQRDREQIWKPLRAKATRWHPDNEETAALMALKEWSEFLAQPDQAHWRCACADADDRPERS